MILASNLNYNSSFTFSVQNNQSCEAPPTQDESLLTIYQDQTQGVYSSEDNTGSTGAKNSMASTSNQFATSENILNAEFQMNYQLQQLLEIWQPQGSQQKYNQRPQQDITNQHWQHQDQQQHNQMSVFHTPTSASEQETNQAHASNFQQRYQLQSPHTAQYQLLQQNHSMDLDQAMESLDNMTQPQLQLQDDLEFFLQQNDAYLQ